MLTSCAMKHVLLKFLRANFMPVVSVRSYYITTPIFYVNAPPHIGHLYSVVIADAARRFQQLTGKKCDVFSTGTDEHGLKVELAARKDRHSRNASTSANGPEGTMGYCNRISEKFASLFSKFSVESTDFVRTTESRHLLTVEKLWKHLMSNGHIYEGSYSGWYCVSDEAFLKESQLKEVTTGGKTSMVSIDSGHVAEWTEERNYMFRMSTFKDDLLYWIKSGDVVQPKKFHQILKTMIEEVSLGDLSVSRPLERIHWGIPVPGDPSQCIYVWVDALANYLTAAGVYEQNGDIPKVNLKNWPPDVQVIGKDILKFHGIYWPSMLMAVGLEPPKTIFVHSHWTVDGVKMSKSLGNVVDPFDLADQYTTDGLRYFLLREGVAHSDGNYSNEKAVAILNSELADTLGNLLNRCTGQAINPCQEFPSLSQADISKLCSPLNGQSCGETASVLVDSLLSLPGNAKTYYSSYEFNRVVDAVMGVLRNSNRFFEAHRPWDAAKRVRKMLASDGAHCQSDFIEVQSSLSATLALSMESLRICGIILQPIIPELSTKLLDALNVPRGSRMWSDASEVRWEGSDKVSLKLAHRNGSPLFRRIIKGISRAGWNEKKMKSEEYLLLVDSGQKVSHTYLGTLKFRTHSLEKDDLSFLRWHNELIMPTRSPEQYLRIRELILFH